MSNFTVEEKNTLVTKVVKAKFPRFRELHEDLIQEGWIGLIRAEKYFSPNRGSYATYISRAVYNQCCDYLRRVERWRKFPTTPVEDTEITISIHDSGFDEIEISELLSKLCPEDQVFVLELLICGRGKEVYKEQKKNLRSNPDIRSFCNFTKGK